MSKVRENNTEKGSSVTSTVIEIPGTKTTTSGTEINSDNNNNNNNRESSQEVANIKDEKDLSNVNNEIVPLPKVKLILVFVGYVIFENYKLYFV